jgi:hypothetical protein
MVLALANAGCGEDVFGLDDVIGEWETRSINGQAVPGVVTVGGGIDVDVGYEHWTFLNGGDCTIEGEYDGTVDTVEQDDCQYTVDISQQTIAGSIFGTDFDGTINGDRMDIDFLGEDWVLRRR